MNFLSKNHQKLLSIQKKIDFPMLLLSFVWLGILITELVYGTNTLLSSTGAVIWVLFIFYFLLRLVTSPNRFTFLKKNWLFVLAISISVLRFFPYLQNLPVARVVTATFGMQIIWIFTSADQGMRSLRRKLGRRGAGYVLAFTLVVIFAGAAGMLHFEKISEDPQSMQTYPRALWWTAMQMTNIGSGYLLKTTGGRAFCLGISVYAAAMFGYLTALFASMFIDQAAKDPKSEVPSQKSIHEIHEEIVKLRGIVEGALSRLPKEKL
jgi:voltage-gated potassium channel